MGWWGKVLGGTFGFMLGGPLGLLIGAALGHGFDRGVQIHDQLPPGAGYDRREQTQMAFFTATFSVMGHIAKSDGRVTSDEIAVASEIMKQLRLDPDMKKFAKRLFTEGKRPDFALYGVLDQFRRECRGSTHLLRMFIEIQLHAAYADGRVHPREREILQTVCQRLRISRTEFEQIENLVRAGIHYRQSTATAASEKLSLDEAYAVLNVRRDGSDAELKKAYRRLMSQHHPDKLVAKGLPEEMMKIATEKTQEIKAAYERIKADRGLP